ncbi:MAG: SDR family oxidoreductase [Actinomycetia bacterium]|nr:SDR family oxidoreductase [Actinomycetes bacterium]MCP4959549.1 SDR family oxidoreductase [Actinomycetes bacterium]
MDDAYKSHTFEQLITLPTVFRDDLFDEKTVLVSGAAGGIGFATAALFGRLGATVVTCGRDAEKLADVEAKLGSVGVECWSMQMTIRDPEQVSTLMDAVWERQGGLDVLVNNAGGQFASSALDISPKGWAAVVETNLYGTWYMMQEAGRRWIADDGGESRPLGTVPDRSVVNMSTLTGRGSVGIPHTNAARAGQIQLTKSLALEWAPHGIRANAISIGVVSSEGLLNYPPEAVPSFDHNPQRRLGDVHDIAQAAVYLSAPSGEFITGSVVEVAGGGGIWGEYWAMGKPDWYLIEEG